MLKKSLALLAQAGIDSFILSLLGAILVAYAVPSVGAVTLDKPLYVITTYGVSITFFLYGLKLDMAQLKAGLKNWQLHILVQASTFLLFPLLALLIKPFFVGSANHTLWIGIFYLAALPSTVSSSVVMVSLAGGNVVAAIFNATLSSLMGIFITPLWMSLFLTSSNGEYDLSGILWKLCLQVILPVIVGMLCHRFGGEWAKKNKNALKLIDQSIILSIVYQSFSESFYQQLFKGLAFSTIVALALGMIMLFQAIYQLIKWLCRLLHFSEADSSAAIFCGSKKSLVHGTVMSKVLFSQASAIGIYLLPIMIYHAGQLIGASYLARKRREKQG